MDSGEIANSGQGELSGGVTWRHHVAIAALSLAVLLFEVLVTRILSVTLSYHFAFLAISLAMMGLGASLLARCWQAHSRFPWRCFSSSKPALPCAA